MQILDWIRFAAGVGLLLIGMGIFVLQIFEDRLIARENSNMEMYITGVISAVCFLQFFMGIQKADCKFFYAWIGKSAPFYIYILHMGVACVLARFVAFSSLMVKSAVVFLLSFAIYEIAFLLVKFVKMEIKRKNYLKDSLA